MVELIISNLKAQQGKKKLLFGNVCVSQMCLDFLNLTWDRIFLILNAMRQTRRFFIQSSGTAPWSTADYQKKKNFHFLVGKPKAICNLINPLVWRFLEITE